MSIFRTYWLTRIAIKFKDDSSQVMRIRLSSNSISLCRYLAIF